MTTPLRLYSVITDYGTSQEKPIAEHYSSDMERLDALRNRVEHLTGVQPPNLAAEDLARVIEQVLAPAAHVILTEATYDVGRHWRTTTAEPRYVPQDTSR